MRKSYSVHLKEPHLLRWRCTENSKGLLNLIFDSRGLDPESKIVHLHILQCRLCNFQPHFKCIERGICDFTKAFLKKIYCTILILHRFKSTKKDESLPCYKILFTRLSEIHCALGWLFVKQSMQTGSYAEYVLTYFLLKHPVYKVCSTPFSSSMLWNLLCIPWLSLVHEKN